MRGGRAWLGSAVVGLCVSGCYVGLSTADSLGPQGDVEPADEDEPSVDDGGDDEPEPLCGSESVAPARLWRISDSQHAHAIEDLLGLTEVVRVKTPGTTEDSFVNESELFVVNGPLASQYEAAASDAAARVKADLQGRVPCEPAQGDEACAEAFIESFVPRAFRRPIGAAEREAYLGLYEQGAEEGFAAGIGMIVEATLQAPSFLYRTEVGAADAEGTTVSLEPYELAAAVSFLLLDSIPDEPLWAAAEDGSLADPAVLEAQVERLLASPRVQDNLVRIYALWLGTPRIAGITKSSEHFPEFDAALAEAMRTEVERLLERLLDGGTVADLLTSRTAFVNGPLAEFYGVEGVEGEDFVEVELPADERAGVMTRAGLMALLAAPEETSVVHRGLLAQDLLRCNDLPAPPPGVDLNDPMLDGLDQRELAEYRAQEPSCLGCHNVIDPVGLTFEKYDAAGRFRDEVDGEPIDASAEVTGVGSIDDAVDLMERLADDPEVMACVCEQLVIYALGRQLGADDECELEQIQQQVEQAGGALVEPFRAVALSEAFRLRRREEG